MISPTQQNLSTNHTKILSRGLPTTIEVANQQEDEAQMA
jgi:hypothetical protein